MAKEYIEREAWLKTLKTNKELFMDGWGGFDALPPTDKARVDELDNCIALLLELPAADVVERKRGEWEHDSVGFDDFWKCSACKEDWFFEYDPVNESTRVNFCPNCGADMRGDN